jgi:hypothetical protein
MVNKSILILVHVLLITGLLFAQNDGPGNTGLSFLKLGVTSRAISLGEAVVSSSGDASAVHYNPAALFLGQNLNILVMHNASILGVKTEYLAAKLKMTKFAFGLSINTTSVNDIEVREIPGAAIDKFDARNFALGLSAAYKINEMLQLGITGKFIYEKIYIDNASGFAGDIGAMYSKGNLSAGIALANFGSMTLLRNESTKLPSSVRIGASYLFELSKMNAAVRVGVDGFKVLDGGKFHANSGVEFVYKELLSLRAGYQSGYENRFLTAGIGLKYKGTSLDYAFVPYKFSQGNSHTFTLGTSF